MWTEKQLQEKQKNGTIRGYTRVQPAQHADERGKKVARHFSKKSKCLDWMGWNILYWCNEKALLLEEEYRFDDQRRFKFDWAIPAIKVAVEFEGGIFEANSGHKTAKHYTKDTIKYNLAQALGWIVLRFTALNYLTMVEQLNRVYIERKGGAP